jgi:hypothetical protein
MINGRYYDWEHITLKLFGSTLVDVKSITYGDQRQAELVYGKGKRPRGYRKKRYQTKPGKLVLLREEYDRVLGLSDVQAKGLYDIEPGAITCTGDKGDGDPFTDVLEEVVFVERDFDNIEEDGDENTVTLGFMYTSIVSKGTQPVAD